MFSLIIFTILIQSVSGGPLACTTCIVNMCGSTVAVCSPILLSGLFGIGAYISCVTSYCSGAALAICAPICALVPA